jgi:hypothetical protein
VGGEVAGGVVAPPQGLYLLSVGYWGASQSTGDRALTTIVAGICGHSLDYCRINWRSLVAISALPFFLGALCSAFYLYAGPRLVAFSLAAHLTGDPQFRFILESELADRGWLLYLTIGIGLILNVWHFVRIARFMTDCSVRPLSVTRGEAYGVLLVALYSFLVMLLLGIAIGIYIVAQVLCDILLQSVGSTGWFTILVRAVLAIVFLFLVLVSAVRFGLGFPRVALGQTPNIFKDIWIKAKPATLGIAWRTFLCSAIFAAVGAINLYFLAFPLIDQHFPHLLSSELDIKTDDVVRAIVINLVPHKILGELIASTFTVYMSVFYTIANRRLFDSAANIHGEPLK